MVRRISKITVGDTTRVVVLGGPGSGGAPMPQLVATEPPTISGTLQAGQTVTASAGTWNATPDSLAYVWRRNGIAIPGATSASYTLQLADIGTNTITVTVFAFKAGWQPGNAVSDPVSVDPAAEPDQDLWYAFPALPPPPQSGLPKLVFAHYFPPHPMAFANTAGADYWENNYLTINGEGGIHAAYGGFMRDRPLKYGAPWSTSPSYEVNYQRREIENAMRYHIDGFFVNILGIQGQNWTRTLAMFQAASTTVGGQRVYDGFYVIPMLDADGSGAASGYVAAANALNTLLNFNCVYRHPNGTYVVASYRAENAGNSLSEALTFWSNLKQQLQTVHGKTVEFWHVFLNVNRAVDFANGPAGARQVVTGRWDEGVDPASVTATSTSWITQARNRGERGVLYPVWGNSQRPASWFDETLNTTALRVAWTKAINNNVEFVQLCTWNDYHEGGHHNPSRKRGEAVLALNSWYIARWKTGSFPTILRDALFVSHRAQMFSTVITGGQTHIPFQNMNRAAESPLREHVEILSFLTAPDTITVTIGGSQYQYNAPAGMHVQTYPMEYGTVSVSTGRGVVVNSPYEIRSTSGNYDRDYCWCYSLDPIPTGTAPTNRGNPTPAS